ncbi:MAG: hypothetical protein ACP5U0_09470, partial [Caldisphaera sp.]
MEKPDYKILGFDTETFNGYVKVLACSDGTFIENSDTYTLINWLYEKMQDADYGFWFNIEYDLSAILKSYLMKNATEIRENRKLELALSKLEKADRKDYEEIKNIKTQIKNLTTLKKMIIGNYKVFIINGKGFKISKIKKEHRNEKRKVEFFDISNFYKSQDSYFSLDQVAAKYLNEHKNNEELGIDRKKIGTEAGYYENHKDLIIKYCVNDALLTAKLAQKLFESLTNLGYSIPKKFYSKASIAKQMLIDLGYVDHKSKSFDKIAKKAYHGGIFITYALGHYDNIINLDINSAYPFELQRLTEINFDNNNTHILTPANPDFNKCDYKFYHIQSAAIPILQYKGKNGNIYYVDGHASAGVTTEYLDYWITQYDKDILDLYGYQYEIIESYGLYNIEKKHPFKYINNLYTQKSEIKKKFGSDSIEYSLQKIIINSTYGLLAQSKPKETQFTNFVYASYITASCRYTILYIKKKLEDLGCKTLFIATDGIYSQMPESKEEQDKVNEFVKSITNQELGGFSVDRFKSVTIFENGVYIEEFTDGTEKMKRRGLSGKIEDDNLLTKTEDIIMELKKCNSPILHFEKYTPIKYKQAVIQKKENSINLFEPIKKEINPFKSALGHYQIDEEIAGVPLKEYFKIQIPLKLLNK